MKFSTRLTALALLAAFGIGAVAPGATHADPNSRQKSKNQWRNAAIGSGAVAAYGLLKGNKTATVLGAAGAAYSASRYEKDRRSQSNDKRARAARYHREYFTNNGRRQSRTYYYKNGHKYYYHNR